MHYQRIKKEDSTSYDRYIITINIFDYLLIGEFKRKFIFY